MPWHFIKNQVTTNVRIYYWTFYPLSLICKSVFAPIPYSLDLLLFSCSVMSNSLWPYGLQRARLPCPSPSPRACSNSGPLSQWCHPTISSSVFPFSPCLLSFPASGKLTHLFQWVSSSYHVAKVLKLPFQHQSFQWIKLGRVSGGSVVKNLPASARDMGLIPGPGRSYMLILEDPTCLRATKPLCHSSWACALEREPQLSLCAAIVEAWAPKTCAPQQEKPPQWEAFTPQLEEPPLIQLEKRPRSNKDPAQLRIINK